MRLTSKLILGFIGVGLIPLAISNLIALRNSQQTLEQKASDQLETVREIKAQQVKDYFAEREADLSQLAGTVAVWQSEAFRKLEGLRDAKKAEAEAYITAIENQIVTFANNGMVVDAMREFPALLDELGRERGAEVATMHPALQRYYNEEFLSVYAETNGKRPSMQPIIDRLDDDSIVAQFLYIADNPHPLGGKETLDAAEDGSGYSALHAKVHPVVRQYLQKFGYYDIFLVDIQSGDIVYSVFKELDFSTSLLDGPYADTNFGRAFRDAAKLNDRDQYVLVDYEAYFPSYEAPASFIAAPIFDGAQKVGVAIFQMPIDRLNSVVGNRSGLGETGETYMVGPDRLMRSDSFRDPQRRSVRASFDSPSTGSVPTDSVQRALGGESGAMVARNYKGDLVLSAYAPMRFGHLRWAFIAEIELLEALNPKLPDGREFYADFIERNGYYDLFLLDAEGFCFYTVAKEPDYRTNLVNGEFADSGLGQLVRKVMASHAFGFADYAPYAPSNGDPAAFMALPLLQEGSVQMVLALQLSSEMLNTIMHQSAGMGASAETYLVGKDKRMRSDSLMDPTNRSLLASFAGTVATNGVDSQAVNEALTGKSGTLRFLNYDDRKVISSYAPISIHGEPWALIAEIDEDEAFQAIASMRRSLLLTGLLFAVATVLIAVAFGRSVSRPINAAVITIGTASTETTAIAERVAQASQQLAEGTHRQAESLDASSSAIGHLTHLAGKASEMAHSSSDLSEKAAQASAEGLSAMRKLADKVQAVAEAAARMEAAIHDINRSSDAISKVVGTIDGIAFQTNILALNAAVEAARAGEAGAGFAVVADEVRSLADRASNAARQTADMIRESVEKSHGGVQANQVLSENLDEVRRGAATVDAHFDDIRAIISQVTQAMQQLRAASTEQTSGITGMADSIHQIHEITQVNSSSAADAADASRQMTSQAHQLDSVVRSLQQIVSARPSCALKIP